MNDSVKHEMKPLVEVLAEEIEEREANDPNTFAQAKAHSVKRARESGLSEEDISQLFGLDIDVLKML